MVLIDILRKNIEYSKIFPPKMLIYAKTRG